MTRYSSHRHKRPGSNVYTNGRQAASDGGISDEPEQSDGDEEADNPTPGADDSDDDCDPDPPATGGDVAGDDDEVPAWKESGYPRRPEWAPDCPGCGGPVIGIAISGPGVGQVTPCGCNVAPSAVDSL